MNKKLVAVAVAGAFALPMAAQAQTANVTLYGRANLDMEFVNGKILNGGPQATTCVNVNTCNTTNPTVFRVSTNSSRFGLRGTESLGGGLSAIFQLENSVPWDAGGGTLGGRETFVGLQGSWGTFKMGRFLAPYDDIHPIFGNVPTLTTTLLSTASLWAQGFAGAQVNGGFDDRFSNSIRYDSPTVSGFNGAVQYSTGEDTRHSGGISLGGFYNNGPIQVGVAYEKHKEIRAANLDDDAFSVAGGYNFGMFRIGAVYERLKYETPSGDLKRDYWSVGGTVNLGPGQLYLNYGDASKGKGSAADGTRVAGLAKGSNTDSRDYSISYTYPLSKRTLTYVGYHRIDNKENASYTFNINAYPSTTNCSAASSSQTCVLAGTKPQGVVFGLVHFF